MAISFSKIEKLIFFQRYFLTGYGLRGPHFSANDSGLQFLRKKCHFSSVFVFFWDFRKKNRFFGKKRGFFDFLDFGQMAKNAFFGEKRGFFDFLDPKIGISDPKIDPQTSKSMILGVKSDQIDPNRGFGQKGRFWKLVFSTIFLIFFEKSENEQKSTFF